MIRWHRISRTLFRALAPDAPAPASKYHARPCDVDGIRFDSTKEARRYRDLRLLETAGAITALEVQPRFPIVVAELFAPDPPPYRFVTVGHYTADFRYVDATTGEIVIEDTKSGPTRTTAYRLRKRIVEATYGITIREV